MALRDFPISNFAGGLNLRDQPGVVAPGFAIDALNVDFTDLGAVKQRSGFGKFTAAEGTNRFDSLTAFYKADGTKQLVAGSGTRLEALNTSGAVVASATGLSGGPYEFERFGQPNTEVLYAGNGTDTVRKWNGSAWSAPTATVDGTSGRAMPKARYLAVQDPDNRLVASGFATTTGGPHGATSSPSHVYFSEAGNPEAWLTANSVQLRPGDGEFIAAVVAWQGQIFVFKQTAFWVFWGNATDGEGNPEFNRRGVEAGVGVDSPRAVAVGRDGIYFLSRKGIYRTTGDQPQLVSDLVAPVFFGDSSEFFQSGELNHAAITACCMAWHDERLYVGMPTGASTTVDRTLVFDPQHGWWSLYDLPAAAMTSFRAGDQAELLFAYSGAGAANTTKDIGRFGPAYTADGSAAIISRWRSGWPNLGSPNKKRFRFAKVDGTGQCRISVSADWNYATHTEPLDFTDDDVGVWGDDWGFTWGPIAAIRTRVFRRGYKGTTFSIAFTNQILNQPWTVYSLTLWATAPDNASNANTYPAASS